MWDLIDWVGVGFGALWITGLAMNLAVFSLADYRRSQTGQRLRDIWMQPGYQMTSNSGLAAFCLGLIGGARADWERLVWVGLGLGFIVFAVQAGRAKTNTLSDKSKKT